MLYDKYQVFSKNVPLNCKIAKRKIIKKNLAVI